MLVLACVGNVARNTAFQELWPKMCPCKERFFCCTLSFLGSTVFESEQTVRNLSDHGNTRKCAFAPSPNSPKKSRVLATYWAARRRAKPTAVQGPHSRRQKKLTAPRRRQQNPSGEVLEFWAVQDEQDFAAHAHYVLYPKVELPLWPMASFVWSRNEPS